MTLEEAIELTKTAFDMWEREWDCGEDWSDVHEARDMAIKALQDRPTARRIYDNECSACHYKVTAYDNYCSMCGAYLRRIKL